MSRREEFEQLVDAFAEYEGVDSQALRFLIEMVCSLQIALDEITRLEIREPAETFTLARAIANDALNK